jgi:hypothetical protein
MPPVRTEAIQPTLAGLTRVLHGFGAASDLTLVEARSTIGPPCDPGNPEHAAQLRGWLNRWTCRIGIPPAGETDHFVANLTGWWIEVSPGLPDESARLARLTDQELQSIASAYGSLAPRIAAVNRKGVARSFGPTATAKLLYFLRPLAVTPWDEAIARHVPGEGQGAFLEHLLVCRAWANALIEEAAAGGLEEDEIGPSVGRPLSSVAKLIDEWLYMTLTAGAR